MGTFNHRLSKFALIIFTALLVSTTVTRANLVITPTWDSTITSDANASTITNTIIQALLNYKSTFSNNMTVTIYFQEVRSGLGQSSTYYNPISYQLFRSHLIADATTLYNTNSWTSLPNTTTNPVNNSVTTDVNLPEGRAIGLTGVTSDGMGNFVSWDPPSGAQDGTVFLNTTNMNLSRAATNSLMYDLYDVTQHEVNEVLGIGSALSDVNASLPFPSGYASPEDFFRYTTNGLHSFTTNASAVAYFSLDGKTLYAQYNEHFGGDYNDWFSYPFGAAHPRVQDAFSTPGTPVNQNVELVVLNALGYNLMIPKMTVTRVNRTNDVISWSPATPGYVLTSSTNIATPGTNWIYAASGTNNPVTITNLTPKINFYRLDHP